MPQARLEQLFGPEAAIDPALLPPPRKFVQRGSRGGRQVNGDRKAQHGRSRCRQLHVVARQQTADRKLLLIGHMKCLGCWTGCLGYTLAEQAFTGHGNARDWP